MGRKRILCPVKSQVGCSSIYNLRNLCQVGVGLGQVGLWFGFVSGVGRAGFAGDLHALFPITGVEGLHKFAEASECRQLIVVNHIVFDSFG